MPVINCTAANPLSAVALEVVHSATLSRTDKYLAPNNKIKEHLYKIDLFILLLNQPPQQPTTRSTLLEGVRQIHTSTE